MANTNNILPRLAIKRRFEQIIADEWDLNLVDYFKTSVDDAPQVWITQIDESYSNISSIRNKKLETTCSVTIVVFSDTQETAVHEIIQKLMDISPSDFPDIRINDINPQVSSTNYQNDASNGHVMAAITLDLKYFYERN